MKTIQSKLVLILIGVFLLFAALDLGILSFSLYPSFLEIEKDGAVKDAKRIQKAIRREIYHLDSLCHDWAAWNETYAFAASADKEYVADNLPESSFYDNRLNYICILDSDNRVLFARGYDLKKKKYTTIDGMPEVVFPQTHPLVTYPLGGRPLADVTIKGIFSIRAGSMMIASRPILTNDNTGPIRGSVIMGRLLDTDTVKKIMEQTEIQFSLHTLQGAALPATVENILTRITASNPYHTVTQGDSTILTYTTLADIINKPVLLLQVTGSREISIKGLSKIRLTIFLKIASAILIVSVLLFLQKRFFAKLERLTRHIHLIRETEDLSRRIKNIPADEIGMVGREFNHLLDTLQENILKGKGYEEELRNSERKFRTIVANAPAVIFIIDLEGKVLLFEGKTLEKIRLTSYQMVGHNVFDLFYDYPEVVQDIRRALSGESVAVEVRIQGFVFKTTYTPYYDRVGNLIGTIGIAADVTEQKESVTMLREREEQYRSIVENSHDGIIIIGPDYRFLYVNEEFCRITGRTSEELVGQDFRLVLDDDSVELVSRRYRKRQQGEEVPSRYEFNILRKSGERRRITFSGNVVRDSNGVMKTIGQLLDITKSKDAEEERQRLEMKLRQAQKMEAIGTLAGGIAHDFNNILSAILGYAQLAFKNSKENVKVRKYIQQLIASSERAKDLVEQILAFSRQKQVKKTPVDIGMIFKEVLKLLRPTIPTTIDIQQQVPSNLGSVLADPTQIHQVIMNLCVNASQAMEEEGGTLRVELAPRELSIDEIDTYQDVDPGSYLELIVSDTGTGMDEETMSHIFEPYFTTKKVTEGTGMGLATVHGIVTDCGGDIRVSSQPGEGTRFHILFPVVEKEIKEVETSIMDLPTGTELVLFVDDEKFLVDIGIEMLNDLGYQVEGRTSSHDALEAFRVNPDKYDIVVTDMTMPEMTGEKLAIEVKKIRPDIPVVICSGFSKVLTQERAERIGVRSFLNKPVTMEEMAHVIRRELDGEA